MDGWILIADFWLDLVGFTWIGGSECGEAPFHFVHYFIGEAGAPSLLGLARGGGEFSFHQLHSPGFQGQCLIVAILIADLGEHQQDGLEVGQVVGLGGEEGQGPVLGQGGQGGREAGWVVAELMGEDFGQVDPMGLVGQEGFLEAGGGLPGKGLGGGRWDGDGFNHN